MEELSTGRTAQPRSASRSQVVLLTGFGTRLLVALFITSLLGRALGPDTFGYFTLIGTVLFLAHVVFDAGTGSLAMREIARHRERERPLLEGLMAWRRTSGSALGLAVLVWALLEANPQRRIVLLTLAVVLPLMTPGVLMSVFRVRQELEGPELIRFASQGLVLFGIFAFVALGVPGELFALLLVLQALTNAAGIGWLAIKRLGYRMRAGLRGRGLRPFLAMATVHAAVVLVQMAYFYADVFLVLFLRGEQELGAYSAAFRPINPLLMLPGILTAPLLPVLSRVARHDPVRLALHVRGAASLTIGVGALAAAAGAALASDLVRLLYGGRYSTGLLDAGPAMLWLAIALGVVLSTSVFSTALLAKGREDLLLLIALLGLAINVVGNLIVLPIWGFTAAAIVTASTYCAVGAVCIVALLRLAGPVVVARSHALALIPGAIVFAILWNLDGTPLLRVAVGCALGVAGVVLLLALPGARDWRRELALEQLPQRIHLPSAKEQVAYD